MADKEHAPARPVWLNDEFIKTCIKNDIGASSTNDIDIEDVKVQYVVPKGENYASIILRLVVNGDFGSAKPNGHLVNGKSRSVNGNANGNANGNSHHDEKRYILKVPHSVESMKGIMDEFAMFDKEVDMYVNVMPKYEHLLTEVGLETKFACGSVHHNKEIEVFAMPDLGAQGYVLANRMHGTDLEHTKILMHKIARLHGVSMKCYEQNQLEDLPAYYFKGMIRDLEDEKLRAVMEPLFGRAVFTEKNKELANDLKQRPGYEKEAEMMDKLADIAFDLLCKNQTYEPNNPFNALLHGDCWVNNMLFKYDDNGKPVDVMLLDLQCSYVGSIANDFMYFFLSSVSDNVREHHYYYTVEYYYETLIKTLEKVGYEGTIPTLEQLHKELVKSSTIFLMTLSYMLALIKKEHGEEASDRSKSEIIAFEDMSSIGNSVKSSPVFIKTLFITVDLLREIGTFEYHAELLRKMND